MPTGYSPPEHRRTAVVTVVVADGAGLHLHRVTRRERLSARLHAERWDHELARGSAPECSAPLALRAQTLVSAACRRELATTLRRVLDQATGWGPPEWNARGSRHRLDHVLAARREIEALITLLLAPGPVPARGVARVRILLTEGGGPLHRAGAATDLASELHRARQALDPASTWTL